MSQSLVSDITGTGRDPGGEDASDDLQRTAAMPGTNVSMSVIDKKNETIKMNLTWFTFRQSKIGGLRSLNTHGSMRTMITNVSPDTIQLHYTVFNVAVSWSVSVISYPLTLTVKRIHFTGPSQQSTKFTSAIPLIRAEDHDLQSLCQNMSQRLMRQFV